MGGTGPGETLTQPHRRRQQGVDKNGLRLDLAKDAFQVHAVDERRDCRSRKHAEPARRFVC
jgi:hypothetical protein